jgi:hypothetical protein
MKKETTENLSAEFLSQFFSEDDWGTFKISFPLKSYDILPEDELEEKVSSFLEAHPNEPAFFQPFMTDDKGDICQIPNLYVKQKSGEPNNFPLEPSSIFTDDKSRWILWFFNKPTTDVDFIENIQGQLARAFRGDLSATKIGQMLPIPGVNGVELHKFDSELTYDLPDLESLLVIPDESTDKPIPYEGEKIIPKNGGWICLWRAIEKDRLWPGKRDLDRHPFTPFEAWIDILLNVRHKDHFIMLGYEKMEEKRGEWIVSYRYLAQRWGWSRQKVIDYLDFLQEDQKLNYEKSHQKSHLPGKIILMNWDTYQPIDFQKKPPKKPLESHPFDAKKSHQKGHPKSGDNLNDLEGLEISRFSKKATKKATPKSEKKAKPNNVLNKKHMLKFFERFWDEYPRKKGRKKAKEKFLSLSLDEEKFKRIMEALRKQKESDEWKRDKAKKYIPHPATWLHGERWEDEVESPGDTLGDSGPMRDNFGNPLEEIN